MNLRKHNILFFVIVSIVAFVLFKTTVIYKTWLFSNGFSDGFNHKTVNYILILYFFILNIFLHKKHLLKASIYGVITAILSYVLASITFALILAYFQYLDQQRTPLGWSFNYHWFRMIFLSIYLIISINWIDKRMNRTAS
jgi:hypothetical protein